MSEGGRVRGRESKREGRRRVGGRRVRGREGGNKTVGNWGGGVNYYFQEEGAIKMEKREQEKNELLFFKNNSTNNNNNINITISLYSTCESRMSDSSWRVVAVIVKLFLPPSARIDKYPFKIEWVCGKWWKKEWRD